MCTTLFPFSSHFTQLLVKGDDSKFTKLTFIASTAKLLACAASGRLSEKFMMNFIIIDLYYKFYSLTIVNIIDNNVNFLYGSVPYISVHYHKLSSISSLKI